MTTQEKNLLDLLCDINRLETRCKRLDAPEAVPPSVYKLLGRLRDELAKWGCECIVNNPGKDSK
jgi:hypothetical protein